MGAETRRRVALAEFLEAREMQRRRAYLRLHAPRIGRRDDRDDDEPVLIGRREDW
jgi:hypothetical protein